LNRTVRIIGSLAALATIGLAACGGGDSSGRSATDSATAACPQTPLTISIDETSFAARSGPFLPPKGERILVVKATAHNDGDAAVAIRATNFSASDGADSPVPYHVLDTGRAVRMSGTVNAGKQLSGEIDFGVPAAVNSATIEYDDGCQKLHWPAGSPVAGA
jgi:hypothetical protein